MVFPAILRQRWAWRAVRVNWPFEQVPVGKWRCRAKYRAMIEHHRNRRQSETRWQL
jgi:hypothetical protein